MSDSKVDKLKTILILKHGSLTKLLHTWALSDEDFLTTDEKLILVEHYNIRFIPEYQNCIVDLKGLEDLRIRNLRVKHGIYR